MKPYTLRCCGRFVVAATFVSALFALTTAARSQGTKADYARAEGLRELTRGKVFKDRVEPHWFAKNDRFWYRNRLAAGASEFILVDAVAGTRKPAFDHAKLAEALGKAAGKDVDAKQLPIDRIEVADDGAIRFEAFDKGWRFDVDSGKLADGPKLEAAKEPERSDAPAGRQGGGRQFNGSRRSEDSPDGKWTATIKDHNVWLRKKDGGEEFAVSMEGAEGDAYEPRVYWAPDSKHFVAIRTEKGSEHQVYLIESTPKDQLQPKLHSFNYQKPGDRVAISKPHLFDVSERKETPIDDALFANPWSIEEYRWSPDSKRFTFLFNQRGHQVLRIVGIDAATGEARTIIDEQSKTFIDYSGKKYSRYFNDPEEILWMSERDGWCHLYLFHGASGQLKNQVTRGEWVVRGVDRVDEDKRQIYFRAGGIHSDQDPYFIHFARVNFDGTGLVALTEGNGTHQVVYSPDRRFILDTYSRVDLPPVTELRRVDDGALVCELEKADWSALLETGWKAPEPFVAKARDGKTDIFGVIWRPTNFDPARKYPVIETIYAGPQGSFVPKAFSPLHRAQALAELGFIVVQMDGMGTSNRSKAFHDVCWKNLGDAGFPDRILWMKAAAQKYPYMDLDRVGVYGGSAGGQNALGAVLTHGEFYKVAAADCGCHDNRMDKIWWNELWMGWPVGPHYAEQSNVTLAHKLQGKLLLTVGELDRNVDPASTMQVVDALIKADKDFELIVFPGGGHGSGGSRYGDRRRNDFFVRHLLGVEPRSL